MAAGQDRASQIRAVDLVGPINPVVNQPAVNALVDSFRSGVITAEDVLARRQQRGIQGAAAAEQFSPAAVESRRAQTELTGAQARAGLPLVEPTAELQKTQLELQAAEAKYGPGVRLFQTLSPEAGIVDRPVLANGNPDYAKQAEIGLQLAAKKLRKTNAIERLKIPSHGMREGTDAAGNKVLLKINEFGEHVTPELEAELRKQAAEPLTLEQMQPGTVQTAPVPTAPVTPAVTPPAGVAPTVTPTPTIIPSVTPTAAVGQVIPGQGLVIGVAGPKEAKEVKENEQKIAEIQANNSLIQRARSELVRPGVVGPAAGVAPVKAFNQLAAAFGLREGQFQSQRELEILVSKKILEGAQAMKGNLSDKDVRFLRDTAPKLTDTPEVWNRFLNAWEAMNQKTVEVLSGKAPKGSSVLDTAGQPVAASAGGAATQRQTLPSGAVLALGSDGVWRLEKAPTNLAPPVAAPTFFPEAELQALAAETGQPIDVLRQRRASALRGKQAQKLVIEPRKTGGIAYPRF